MTFQGLNLQVTVECVDGIAADDIALLSQHGQRKRMVHVGFHAVLRSSVTMKAGKKRCGKQGYQHPYGMSLFHIWIFRNSLVLPPHGLPYDHQVAGRNQYPYGAPPHPHS